ncbi:hypothetical protein [Aestuariicoccus sp. MJ-SS9]|uniref:hypothetical protein n=1 Tax=Aestuariicoccus sp. MJ-SS9 TaxID=3079855 RepID=UPI00290AA65A|nr:hypothetical protein [Aestuariicoccus sp. MJ-SS9]MDU8912801.1 hypothetical protein [Aestuariicoccus sp. MJ-SS9]
MSDPVTNVEIEDVLSSIRRLVSQDVRPERAPRKPEAPQRLVLTPAQRVMDDEPAEPDMPFDTDANEEPAAQAESDRTDKAFAAAEPDMPAESDMAEAAEAPVLLTDPELPEPSAPEGPQAADPDDDSAESDGALAEMVEREVVNALRGILPEPKPEALQEDAQAGAPEEVGSTQNADVPASQEQSPETRPTDLQDDETPSESVEAAVAVASEPDDMPAPSPLRLRKTPEADSADKDTAPADDTRPAAPAPTLESKIAALEQMIAQSSEEWEAESPEDIGGASLEEAMPWQDHVAELAADEDFEQERPHADPPDPQYNVLPGPSWHEPPFQHREVKDLAPSPPEEPPMIDEDVLRDMVADIVRQELQGVLGERITRNVRKLVRREINRALLTQDLE